MCWAIVISVAMVCVSGLIGEYMWIKLQPNADD